MRPNNPNKRLRGRNRNKSGNPLARSYESNGPDVKIRGSALQVADKYAQLARDAQSAGDRVMAENYLQHAEHYYRIVAAAYEQNNQRPPHIRPDDRRLDGDYRGEQPHVNGFDGLDDDDDSGLRRAIRGDHGDDDDDGDDAPDARGGHHQHRETHHQQPLQAQPSHAQPRHDNGHAGGGMNGHHTDAHPTVAYEGGEAADEEEDGGEAKPKRRSRSSRSRSRRRAAAEAGEATPGAAPVAAVEPSEPTS